MRRALLPRQMMVCNNQVDAQAAGGFRGGESADAGIDADDEMNSLGRGPLDHIAAQIVALFDAMRNMEIGSAPTKFYRRLQNHDGGGAIDVVIAVDEDAFFALDGSIKAVDGSSHTVHQIR